MQKDNTKALGALVRFHLTPTPLHCDEYLKSHSSHSDGEGLKLCAAVTLEVKRLSIVISAMLIKD